MTENLKKCPFCGGKPNFENEGSDYGFYVVCSRCGCWTGALRSKDETLKRWNNRPIEDAQSAEIKRLREALAFYAHGKHLWDADERDPACDAYDIVSGQVENGKYAQEVLEGCEK